MQNSKGNWLHRSGLIWHPNSVFESPCLFIHVFVILPYIHIYIYIHIFVYLFIPFIYLLKFSSHSYIYSFYLNICWVSPFLLAVTVLVVIAGIPLSRPHLQERVIFFPFDNPFHRHLLIAIRFTKNCSYDTTIFWTPSSDTRITKKSWLLKEKAPAAENMWFSPILHKHMMFL